MAASESSARRYVPQLRTALVLTGTGAAGAYHAGVLRALVEAGVKIDLVAGRGIGAVGALFGAIDGGTRLWGANGVWRSAGVRRAYRWRMSLRAGAWMLAAAGAATLAPVLALAGAAIVFPAGYLLALVGVDAGPTLADAYAQGLRTVFAPSRLPVLLPRLVLVAVASLFALLAIDAVETALRARARRAARGGLWWRLLGAPLDRARAVAWFGGGLWQLMRGTASIQQPSAADLGQRYVELLTENLGQPGFCELLVLTHDVDARRDVVFGLLADGVRRGFFEGRPGAAAAARGLETVDLGAAPRHALDALAAALSLPIATDPHPVRFAAGSAWRGETHRLCDRVDGVSRLLDEAARAGVRQVIVVSALPAPTGPHRLGAARRDLRGQAGQYLLGLETVALAEALAIRRGQFQALFEVRPAHNPIGPFDLAGCWDERSARRQTLGELVDRGYEDGVRQFVDAVLGASGELIETTPPRAETPSLSERLASDVPAAGRS